MSNIKTNELSELYGVEPEIIENILNSELSYPSKKLKKIVTIAHQYFGSKEAALNWFVSKNRGLGYATPISLLTNDSDFERVENSLIKLQNGFTC